MYGTKFVLFLVTVNLYFFPTRLMLKNRDTYIYVLKGIKWGYNSMAYSSLATFRIFYRAQSVLQDFFFIELLTACI